MYIVGNPLEDDRDLYGRRATAEALYSGPDHKVFLVGMRRTGKTSTLLFLARRALAQGDLVPLYVAPEGCESIRDLRDGFANALSRRRALLPRLPGGFLKLRELPLQDLLLVAAEAAEDAGKGLLVLIDEAEALVTVAEHEPAIVGILRNSLPEVGGSRVIVTGSRHAVRLRHLTYGQSEPMLASFVQHTLSPVLDRADAEGLIGLTQRGGVGRVHFSEEERRWLLDRTGGHPYITQAACDHALRLGTGPAPALNAAMASFPATNAFQQDMERTSPSERDVIQSLLDGRPLQDWHEPFVGSLAEIGVLTPERRLAVPALIDFLRRVGWDALPSRLNDVDVAPGASVRGSPAVHGGTRYRTLRKLGEGGFGEVFLMEADSGHGVRRLVAVKLLHPGMERQSALAARLRDEARILARVRHPAIVKAEDIARVNERLGILMEYVPGVDLRDYIVQQRKGLVPLPPQRVVAAIIAEVADALDVAYNRPPEGEEAPFRVLHRDIKPHNIRLTEDGEVKVLDFGVAGAHFPDQEADSRRGGGGTLVYMPPERHRGQHSHPASDIFSLGVVLAELSSGLIQDTPWPANEAALRVMVEPTLDWMEEAGVRELLDLTERMLHFSPQRRPSAAEVALAARELVDRLEGPELRSWARRVVPIVRRDPSLAPTNPSRDPETAPDPDAGEFRELMSIMEDPEDSEL